MSYASQKLLMPKEFSYYKELSNFAVKTIQDIIVSSKNNKVFINTNLKLGLPMENINKVAGPMLEAWAQQTFLEILEKKKNPFFLKSMESGSKLNMADIILHFENPQFEHPIFSVFVDVKSTSFDIKNSGKSPNITSFERIRSAYITDPNYLFIILSLKHKVTNNLDKKTGLFSSTMEIVDSNAYDLKLISDRDISYNPALGTGQLQIRDIHNVSTKTRTTWDFCEMLDKKFIASKKGFSEWLAIAKHSGWLDEN